MERNVENPFGDGRTFQRVARRQLRKADLGTVTDLEIAYQQPFTFLPSGFSGFGLNSNVTIATSSVDVPTRENEDLPFFQQSDLVYNIIPYYQQGNFEARLAVNYQGDYLEDLDDVSAGDSYIDDRTTVDINTSYQFTGLPAQPELVVQVENLTDAPEVIYVGQEDRLAFHFLSGRTITVGLSTEF